MFSSLLTRWRMSQAGVTVQSLLELHNFQEVSPNGAIVANKLVSAVYDESPRVVSGQAGLRPHKMTLAAAALAKGIIHFQDDLIAKRYFFLSLGTLLLEISEKPHLYALTDVDHYMLELAQKAYFDNMPPDPFAN
jgi:hypothetical protein